MKTTTVIQKQYRLLHISQNLTGKMTGMPAITSSMLCNDNCTNLKKINNSICKKCYTEKYLKYRPFIEKCYEQNTKLLSESIIPIHQLPFINAAMCRFETFGDITNPTHLQNFINIAKKNKHCTFTLFTKNYSIIINYFKNHKQPNNLLIVISSLLLNKPFDINKLSNTNIKNIKIFTVYTKQYATQNNIIINCGNNRCIDCKRCYQKNKNPIYISEILK